MSSLSTYEDSVRTYEESDYESALNKLGQAAASVDKQSITASDVSFAAVVCNRACSDERPT